MKVPTAFPLEWPAGIARNARRQRANFRVTMSRAVEDTRDALRLFSRDTGKGVSEIVISSNVTLGVSRPADPGIAMYFRWDGDMRCIAVDKYDRPEDNLRAIYYIIEARRLEHRHGGLAIVRAAFKGFLALPPGAAGDWREVLGIGPDATFEEAQAAYRAKAREVHPDAKGGSAEEMIRLNAAMATAREVLGGRAA